VIAPVEHDRPVRQAIRFELLQDLADLPIHLRDVVVVTRDVLADHGRIRVVRRHLDPRRIGLQGLLALGAPWKHTALVRHLDVEDREERLARIGPVAPVGLLSEVVPDRERNAELVVRLRAVAREVAGGPQVLRKRLDVERRHGEIRTGQLRYPDSVVRMCWAPIAVLVHARDDRGAARRADRRRRERLREADRLARQTVEHRGARQTVPVRAEARTHVLVGDPDDVDAAGGRRRRLIGRQRAPSVPAIGPPARARIAAARNVRHPGVRRRERMAVGHRERAVWHARNTGMRAAAAQAGVSRRSPTAKPLLRQVFRPAAQPLHDMAG
jgi:hypothetical protein